jgi:sulfur relay (sulfurtransferase) complex TusBCD TusD component (DsrE family)
MVQFAYLLAAAMALIDPVALAHPGGPEPENLIKREMLWEASKRSIRDCSASLKGRGLAQRSIARRSAQATALQEKSGLSGSKISACFPPSASCRC